jgi:hypothetical protein
MIQMSTLKAKPILQVEGGMTFAKILILITLVNLTDLSAILPPSSSGELS